MFSADGDGCCGVGTVGVSGDHTIRVGVRLCVLETPKTELVGGVVYVHGDTRLNVEQCRLVCITRERREREWVKWGGGAGRAVGVCVAVP